MHRNVGAGLVLAACVIVVASVGGSWLGWFGIAQVCGADRSLGCVAWPMPVALLVWAAFILGVGALLVWQVRYLDTGERVDSREPRDGR